MIVGRRPLGVLAAAVLVVSPATARAGTFSLAASAGSGYRLSPDAARIPTNVMLAPGFDVFDDLLRAEVGFVVDLADAQASRLDFQLRPMAVVTLPMLPFCYGRLVTGVTRIVHGPVAIALGAAVGVRAGLGDRVGVLVEAGWVPRASSEGLENVVEARLGVVLGG